MTPPSVRLVDQVLLLEPLHDRLVVLVGQTRVVLGEELINLPAGDRAVANPTVAPEAQQDDPALSCLVGVAADAVVLSLTPLDHLMGVARNDHSDITDHLAVDDLLLGGQRLHLDLALGGSELTLDDPDALVVLLDGRVVEHLVKALTLELCQTTKSVEGVGRSPSLHEHQSTMRRHQPEATDSQRQLVAVQDEDAPPIRVLGNQVTDVRDRDTRSDARDLDVLGVDLDRVDQGTLLILGELLLADESPELLAVTSTQDAIHPRARGETRRDVIRGQAEHLLGGHQQVLQRRSAMVGNESIHHRDSHNGVETATITPEKPKVRTPVLNAIEVLVLLELVAHRHMGKHLELPDGRIGGDAGEVGAAALGPHLHGAVVEDLDPRFRPLPTVDDVVVAPTHADLVLRPSDVDHGGPALHDLHLLEGGLVTLDPPHLVGVEVGALAEEGRDARDEVVDEQLHDDSGLLVDQGDGLVVDVGLDPAVGLAVPGSLVRAMASHDPSDLALDVGHGAGGLDDEQPLGPTRHVDDLLVQDENLLALHKTTDVEHLDRDVFIVAVEQFPRSGDSRVHARQRSLVDGVGHRLGLDVGDEHDRLAVGDHVGVLPTDSVATPSIDVTLGTTVGAAAIGHQLLSAGTAGAHGLTLLCERHATLTKVVQFSHFLYLLRYMACSRSCGSRDSPCAPTPSRTAYIH